MVKTRTEKGDVALDGKREWSLQVKWYTSKVQNTQSGWGQSGKSIGPSRVPHFEELSMRVRKYTVVTFSCSMR